MSKINNVNAWNGWDPLEQVLLGNCYSPSFFDDLQDSRTRDLLQTLLYETQEDLANFKRCMEMEGVDVVQIAENTTIDGDIVTSFEDYSAKMPDHAPRTRIGGVKSPMLCPRDEFITMGNKVALTGPWHSKFDKFKQYFDAPETDFVAPYIDYVRQNNISHKERNAYKFSAPSIVRFGEKVVLDTEDGIENAEIFMKAFPEFKPVYHATGGHSDGVFCPMRPGEIISTTWKKMEEYAITVPGWNVQYLEDVHYYDDESRAKEFVAIMDDRKTAEKYYWHPSKDNTEFTNFIDQWLNQWVGFSTESIFEVNMLVINPELVFCPTKDETAFRYIESIGMTPVHVPFRHRHFWDGGLHCLTVDTRRKGTQQNYWK